MNWKVTWRYIGYAKSCTSFETEESARSFAKTLRTRGVPYVLVSRRGGK